MLKGVNVTPNRSSAKTDVPLTNIMIAHYQNESHFIAEKVFPVVPVKKSTNLYYRIPRGALNRHQMQERARGAKPTLGGFDFDEDTYSCKIYGLKVGVTDEDDYDFDDIIRWDNESTFFLGQQCRINREVDFADKYLKTGVWGKDLTGVASGATGDQFLQWNDDASDPVKAVKAQKKTMLESTGFLPNVLSMSYGVWDALTEHAGIIDRIKYGQTAGGPAIVNTATLAALFDVEEIVVGKAIVNTAVETPDQDNHSHTFIMPKSALLTYRPSTPGIRIPSAGYHFGWDVYSPNGMRMRKYRDEEALTDFNICDDAYDQKVVSSDLGVYFDQAIA